MGFFEMILVTGCPNSGTKYTQLMLKLAFGFDIGHEKLGKDGMVSWRALGNEDLGRFPLTFHQTRHPLNNINAMCSLNRSHSVREVYESGIVPYGMGEGFKKGTEEIRLFTAMKIWYYWNEEAHKRCRWSYQVEKIEENFNLFCLRIGKTGNIAIVRKMKKTINSRQNRVGYGKHTWNDLEKADSSLCRKILGMMVRYGYQTP